MLFQPQYQYLTFWSNTFITILRDPTYTTTKKTIWTQYIFNQLSLAHHTANSPSSISQRPLNPEIIRLGSVSFSTIIIFETLHVVHHRFPSATALYLREYSHARVTGVASRRRVLIELRALVNAVYFGRGGVVRAELSLSRVS